MMQIQAKLYMFDSETQNWIEKGRGVISLNDICQSSSEGIFQSRLGEPYRVPSVVVVSLLVSNADRYDLSGKLHRAICAYICR